MSCIPNLTELLINSVYEQNINRGNGTLVDDCGTLWNKVGIQSFTSEVNVKDFGATGLGIVDDSPAFYAAMAALPNGGRIIVPTGLYAVNLVITGNNFHFLGQQVQYSNTGTFGLTPFSDDLPVVQFGDGIIATSNIRFTNFHVRKKSGASTGTRGVRFFGCNRCYLNACSIRGFTIYQIQLDSSATKETDFIFLNNLDIASASLAGSLGIDYNYGGQFTNAIFLTDSNISNGAGSSYIIDLEAQCLLTINSCWIQTGNNQGIHLQASNSTLYGTDTFVDSNSNNDVLVTMDFDALVGAVILGNISIDGKASMTSGTTDPLTSRFFVPYQSLMIYPHIQGQLGFEDTSAAKNTQHSNTDPAQNIYRDGTILNIRSTNGTIQHTTKSAATGGKHDFFAGALQIREAAIAGNGIILGSATQTTVGAAGGASALPATPTGYIRFFLGGTEFVIPYFARV